MPGAVFQCPIFNLGPATPRNASEPAFVAALLLSSQLEIKTNEGSDCYSDRHRIADKCERGDRAEYDADDQSFTVAEQH